jgi:hypothetical protein
MKRKIAIITTRRLFTAALEDFWRWKLKLVAVVAVVALPLTLFGFLAGISQDPTFSAYSSFLTLVMNVALLSVIINKVRGKSLSVRMAYYEGTAPLVRFLLVAFCLALMLLPFFLGALVYVSGVSGGTLVASAPEKAVLGLIWIVLAVPSLLLITRFILATVIIMEPGMTPMAALRQASRLVRGRTFRVAGRLLVLGFVAVVILTVPTAIATTTKVAWLSSIGLALAQLVSSVLVLPVSDLYLFRLHESLVSEA